MGHWNWWAIRGRRPRRLLTSSSARLGPLGGPQDVVARQGVPTLMKASPKAQAPIYDLEAPPKPSLPFPGRLLFGPSLPLPGILVS